MTNIDDVSHWFDAAGIRTADLPHGKPALYRLGHCVWFSGERNVSLRIELTGHGDQMRLTNDLSTLCGKL